MGEKGGGEGGKMKGKGEGEGMEMEMEIELGMGMKMENGHGNGNVFFTICCILYSSGMSQIQYIPCQRIRRLAIIQKVFAHRAFSLFLHFHH